MQQIRSVDVMSVAKVFGILYGGLALIFIPFFLWRVWEPVYRAERGGTGWSVHNDP